MCVLCVLFFFFFSPPVFSVCWFCHRSGLVWVFWALRARTVLSSILRMCLRDRTGVVELPTQQLSTTTIHASVQAMPRSERLSALSTRCLCSLSSSLSLQHTLRLRRPRPRPRPTLTSQPRRPPAVAAQVAAAASAHEAWAWRTRRRRRRRERTRWR